MEKIKEIVTDEVLDKQIEKCNAEFDSWIEKNQESLGKQWLNNILSEAYFSGFEAGMKYKEASNGKSS